MLKTTLTTPARWALDRLGYELVRRPPLSTAKSPKPIPLDFDPVMAEIVESVRPYTMTPPDRIGGLCLAVRYIEAAKVPGAIVECGCWRGGSLMTAALQLLALGRKDRDIYGFDCFGLMPPPTERDVDQLGRSAAELFEGPTSAHLIPEINNVSVEQVEANLRSTDYPPERIRLVEGLIEETIPAKAPTKIAILRLDTDWYESTAYTLEHLFRRIAEGGVLIVDDYGLWQGARDAADEYLERHGVPLLLTRMDAAGRMAVVHRPRLRG